MFSYSGPGDTSDSAVATLCRRSTVDCEAGIAIHGISLGGLLGLVAPRFAKGVTASLTWSAGTMVAGGDSCCGICSNMTECCEPSVPEGLPAVLGGSLIDCVTDSATTPYLPRSRRRLIIGERDDYYGDCLCPLRCENQDRDNGCGPVCVCNHTKPNGALKQCKLGSGYDCGDESDCIMPDGSGYYIPTPGQVGGSLNRSHQGHIFHIVLERVAGRDDNQLALNPSFAKTGAAWGLASSLDWLAEVARMPLQG
jgi:hypothetical protein